MGVNEKESARQEEKFVPDSRFYVLGRDAVIVSIGWCVFFVLMMGTAYLLGGGDPKEYTYFLGFPSWFAICTLIQFIFMGITIFMLSKKFSNVSLDPEDPEYDYEGEKK